MSKDFRGASGQEQSCELSRITSSTEYECNDVMLLFSTCRTGVQNDTRVEHGYCVPAFRLWWSDSLVLGSMCRHTYRW